MPDDGRSRRYDVDWLRIGATFLLFPFHASRPFDHPPWHVKSLDASEVADVWVWFVHQFHMPLFFLLAGWSLERSMGRRELGDVRRDRVGRLLVPFVAGVVLLSPMQAYVEAVTQRGFTDGFLRFLPLFFTSLRWFSWHHLWFLLYLFTFTMLYLRPLSAVPVFRGVKPWHLWAAVVPLALVQVTLRWRWPGYQNLYDDWANFCLYSLYFVGGFLAARLPEVEPMIRRERRRATVVFLVAIVAMLPVLAVLRDRIIEPGPGYFVYWPLTAVAGLSAMIALLGHAARIEHVGGAAFGYLRDAAMPVYVLHQAVIVVLGYWVVAIDAPIVVRYVALLVGSVALTMAAYHLLVRPSRVLRVAFGMRATPTRRPQDAALRTAG